MGALIPTSARGNASAAHLHGFSAYMAANTVVGANTINPFDTIDYDTDGYFVAPNTPLVIPAGLGGLYQVTQFATVIDLNVTSGAIQVIGSPATNAESVLVNDTFGEFAGTCGITMQLPAGATVYGLLVIQGAGPYTLSGQGANAFTLAYLGTLT